MSLFGIIMIFAAIQLFVVGSIIQRGRSKLIPDFLLKNIDNNQMFWYCRAFGNRLILLCLIAVAAAITAFTAKTISFTPIIVFGAGLIIVLLWMAKDRRKYRVK